MNSLRVSSQNSRVIANRQTDEFLKLGRRSKWAFAVLGIAPIPTETIQLSRWKIVPAHLDTSPIPDSAMKRIQAIFAAGLRPKGFVVVHELPKALPASTQDVVEGEFQEIHSPELMVDITSILETGFKVGLAIAQLTATAVIAVGSVVVPAVFALGSALLVDPILIAVTEDDVWIEIDRWWE